MTCYRTGASVRAIEHHTAEEEDKWEGLTMKEKVGAWAFRHEYGLIMASWALSLGAAGAIISRNRYQSVAQKVVQARMWAQGLTVGVLIVAGALTQRQRAEAAKRTNRDHSWAELVRRPGLKGHR